jgi:hypothetical protein
MILAFKSTQNHGVAIESKREIWQGSRSPPSSEGRTMMEVGRSSQYSSLGGSTLGVEHALFGEDRNDLFGIVLDSSSPSLGSDLP